MFHFYDVVAGLHFDSCRAVDCCVCDFEAVGTEDVSRGIVGMDFNCSFLGFDQDFVCLSAGYSAFFAKFTRSLVYIPGISKDEAFTGMSSLSEYDSNTYPSSGVAVMAMVSYLGTPLSRVCIHCPLSL